MRTRTKVPGADPKKSRDACLHTSQLLGYSVRGDTHPGFLTRTVASFADTNQGCRALLVRGDTHLGFIFFHGHEPRLGGTGVFDYYLPKSAEAEEIHLVYMMFSNKYQKCSNLKVRISDLL